MLYKDVLIGQDFHTGKRLKGDAVKFAEYRKLGEEKAECVAGNMRKLGTYKTFAPDAKVYTGN